MNEVSRGLSVNELLAKKFVMMNFEGKWKASIGIPEKNGVWMIYGESFNGKTSFLLQLSKYLTQFDRVAFDSLEEGTRASLQRAVERENLKSVNKRIIFLNKEPIEVLKVRLSRPKSPKIVIIDSLQYAGLTKNTYKELKEKFPKHLFIFNSHAKGSKPKGDFADFVYYDADVKIQVKGFKALVDSRFGGGEDYVIWRDGANKYWGEGLIL